MLNPKCVYILTLASALAAVSSLAGPKWELSEDQYIQLNVLGQVHASFTENAEDEHDIYLRRARIILSGQIADGLKFFTETDNDNAGRNGVAGVSTDIQDAFVEQRLWTDHYLQGGLLLLPFSFESGSSAASILGMDYNVETLKFVETFAWRDYGVIFRGVFADRVAYRIGGFDGYDGNTDTKNPDAKIRGTGHISLNLVGKPENGWFFTQTTLEEEPYFAIGAGADYQNDATLITTTNDTPAVATDNQAWVVDFKSGFPVGQSLATLNGAWHDWDNSTYLGDTSFIESGMLFNEFQVTFKVSHQSPDAGDDTTDYTVGLQHLRHKHNARAGIEFRTGDSENQVLLGCQVFL